MAGDRETYGDYSVDAENQPGAEPDGTEELRDELDRGYSPPERYSPDYGNTPWEEEHRETIDQRLRQEIPDVDPFDENGWEDTEDVDDGEVGDTRAGRLVDPNEGWGEDDEPDLVGRDVGIDGAASSAEEAAVHVIANEWD